MKSSEPKPPAIQAKSNSSFFGNGEKQAFFQSGRQSQPFFSKSSTHSAVVQPKLTIGQPGDQHEQEADHVADQVVQRLTEPQPIQAKPLGAVTPETSAPIQPKPIFESEAESTDDSIRPKSEPSGALSAIPPQIQKADEDEAKKTAVEANKFADGQLDLLVNDFESMMTIFRNWYADQDEGDDDFAKRFKAQIRGGFSSCISSNLGIGAKLINVFAAASDMIAETSDSFVSSMERSVRAFHEAVEKNLLGQSMDLLQKEWPDQWAKVVEAHSTGADWKKLLYQAGIPMAGNDCKKKLLIKLIHEYKQWEWDQHSDSWKGIYKMEDPNLDELNSGAEKEAGKMISNPKGATADVIIQFPDMPLFDGDKYPKDWGPSHISADFIKVPIPDLGLMIDVGGEVKGEAHFLASYGPGVLKNLKIGVTSGQAALMEMAASFGMEDAGLVAIADFLHLDNFRASADLEIPASVSASMQAEVAFKLAASALGIADIAMIRSGLDANALAGLAADFGGQVSIYYQNGELTFNHRKSLSLDFDMNFFLNAFIEAGFLGAHWKKKWNLYHGQWPYHWAMGTEVDLDYDDKPTFVINSFGKTPPLPDMVGDMLHHSEAVHQAPSDLEVNSGNTNTDAIGMWWYKAPEDYPKTIELEGKSGPEFFKFGQVEEFEIPNMDRLIGAPGGSDLRRYIIGNKIKFGAANMFHPEEDKSVWKKARSARLSDVQRGFRALMNLHGHDMNARNEDADHVQDLQFRGPDDFNNIWALNSHINRSNREFLQQIVAFKDKDGSVKTRPLGDPSLIGKYFKIIGFRHF